MCWRRSVRYSPFSWFSFCFARLSIVRRFQPIISPWTLVSLFPLLLLYIEWCQLLCFGQHNSCSINMDKLLDIFRRKHAANQSLRRKLKQVKHAIWMVLTVSCWYIDDSWLCFHMVLGRMIVCLDKSCKALYNTLIVYISGGFHHCQRSLTCVI